MYGIYKSNGELKDGDGGFSKKEYYSFAEETNLLAGMISTATDIGGNLQKNGNIEKYAGKILNWGRFVSSPAFNANFWKGKEWQRKFWMDIHHLRDSYETLVAYNIYNILGFRMDIEKGERWYPAKTSKDDVE